MASLVLGVLAVLCLQLFAGIPAIILGHIARRRAVRHPERYGGRRMATAGFVLGYASLCTTFLLGALFVSAIQRETLKAFCQHNLHQIHAAMNFYALDHHGVWPDDFMQLTNDLPSPRLLVCPADPAHRVPQVEWPPWDPDNVSYQLLAPAAPTNQTLNQTIVRCPIHHLNLTGDGSVRTDPDPAKKKKGATSPPAE